MSNNVKKRIEAIDRELCSGSPQPLNLGPQKRPKTGNGAATFKTATAAANAAREARDEAKKILERCEYFGKTVSESVNLDLKNTEHYLNALEQHERKLRLYSLATWGLAAALTAAIIFS